MNERTLTGKRRYRSMGIRKGNNRQDQVLILQVEYEYYHTYQLGGSVESDLMREWRDATIQDITEWDENVPETKDLPIRKISLVDTG